MSKRSDIFDLIFSGNQDFQRGRGDGRSPEATQPTIFPEEARRMQEQAEANLSYRIGCILGAAEKGVVHAEQKRPPETHAVYPEIYETSHEIGQHPIRSGMSFGFKVIEKSIKG